MKGQIIEEQELSEQEMLDEIEASTKRINRMVCEHFLTFICSLIVFSMLIQSRNIGESSKQSIALMDSIESGMSRSKKSLQQESLHVNAASAAAGGNCYLYMLIILELFTLITLLRYGLS